MTPSDLFDGDLHDYLRTCSVQNNEVHIQHTVNGVIKECKGRIKGFFKKKGTDYLLLTDGVTIRLDGIDWINGKTVPYNC